MCISHNRVKTSADTPHSQHLEQYLRISYTVNNIISIPPSVFFSQRYCDGDREYYETCRQIAHSTDTKELASQMRNPFTGKKNHIILRVTLRLSNTTARSQHKRHHHIFNNIKLMSKEYIRINTTRKTHTTLTGIALALKDTHISSSSTTTIWK